MANNDELKEELDDIKLELSQKFAHIALAFGITGLKAELMGALFMAPRATLSLTELTRRTNFSKASVSRAMRELQMEIPMLEDIKKPNDREKYYRINSDIVEMMTGFLIKTMHEESEPTIAATQHARQRLAELKKKDVDEDLLEEIEEMEEHMDYLFPLYKKYLWMVEKMVIYMEKLDREWREKHPGWP